jgi:hypothetical protein
LYAVPPVVVADPDEPPLPEAVEPESLLPELLQAAASAHAATTAPAAMTR